MRRLNVKLFTVLLVVLLAALAAVFTVHRLQAGNIAQALLYQAEQARDAGENHRAARYLGRYLEFRPEDEDRRAQMGTLLADPALLTTARGLARARFVLEQVLARQPDRQDTRVQLVRVALAGGLSDLAEEHLKVLAKSGPESADVAELQGLLLERQGLDIPAAEAYRRSLALAADRVDNVVRLIDVLRRLEIGRPRAHAGEIDRLTAQALAQAPSQAGVLLAAARRAQEKNELAAARGYLEKGLEHHPVDPRFWQALARVLEKQGREGEALSLLERGLTKVRKEHHFDLWWSLANLHLDQGDLEAALKVQQRIAALPRTRSAVDFLAARQAMHQGQWHEAAAALERLRPAVKTVRDLALQVEIYLGVCYERLNEHGKMLAAYAKAVELDPLSQTGRRGMAAAQWAMGRGEAALKTLQENVALSPEGRRGNRLELARMQFLVALRQENPSWLLVERELEAAAKEQPDAPDVLLLRSEVLQARGREAEAVQVLKDAIARHPDKTELWLGLAKLHERRKHPEEVRRILDEALAKAGDGVDLRLARARWAAADAAVPKAQALRKAEEGVEKFSPEDKSRLWYGLGMLHFQAGSLEQAESLWWRIARLPRHGRDLRLRLLLLDLALMRNDEKGMDRLIQDLRRIEGEEGSTVQFAEAARCLWRVRRGDPSHLSQARKHLQKVLAQRPNWSSAVLARAELEELTGRLDQAIAHYRRAMDLGMRNQDSTRRLVRLLTRCHRFDEAEQEIRKLQSRSPLDDDLQKLAVAIFLQRDELGRAERMVRQVTSGRTGDYQDHLWLGQVLAAQGKVSEEAEKELRKAVAMAGDRSEPWLALVRYLVGTGQEETAGREMEALAARLPAKEVPLVLGRCHEMLGDPAQAAEQFRRALELQPEDPLVRRTVVSALLRAGKLPEAEPLLRRSLAEGDEESQAWARRSLALVLSARGGPKDMQEAFTLVGLTLNDKGEVGERAPAEALEDKLARAKILALQQRLPLRSRAIGLLEELHQNQVLDPEDQFLLAQLYLAQGPEPAWWGKSRDVLLGLVKSRPKNATYLRFFAQGLLQHGDLLEADRLVTRLEQIEKTRKVPAGTLGSTELRARLLEVGGQGHKALKLLREFVHRGDAPPERAYLLASLHARLGNLGEAIATCEQAQVPDAVRAKFMLGVLRATREILKEKDLELWQEQVARVQAYLQQALEKSPDSVPLLLKTADLEELLGRYDQVEIQCRKVLKLDPDNLVALNNLAWLQALRRMNPEESLRLVEHAIAKYGPRPELLDTRAVVLLTLGKTDKAVADLEQVVRDAPNATRWFHLVRAYHTVRNQDSAMRALTQARLLGLEAHRLHPAEREVFHQVMAELKK